MAQPSMTAAQEWRRGWKLVLAAMVGFSSFTIMVASIGVFMAPISNEFRWDRAFVSSGVSIAGVITAVLSPFFGILIDYWGTRRLILPGLVLIACVIASFSQLSGSATQWFVLWSIYGAVAVTVKSTTWMTTVTGAFQASRGLAVGITMAGAAMAQAIAPPLANWLIAETGWRTAFVILGFGWSIPALALCIPFLRDFHLESATEGAKQSKVRPDLPGLGIREALRDRALWQIGASTMLIMTLTIGLLVHQFQILVESGVDRNTAAWMTSLYGIAGIAGKLVTGALMDRFAPNWSGGLTLAAAAFAFLLLLEPFATPVLIVVAMVINGYASGSKLQISAYLTSRYAGMRHFGKIFGVMAAIISAGTAVGPVFAGWIYDLYGNYTIFLIAGVIGAALSGLLIVTLPRYPLWEKAAADARAAA